ncbi:MAG: YraN family protein [SAR202 cluster bacterium]|nr:YraN family protein [SAR202 cluster bacterium]
MATARSRLGDYGEGLARQYLEAQGCQFLAAKYRCRWGEADLVMRQGEVIVFVEVRTRRGATFGSPEESLTPAKARRLKATGQHYLEQQGLSGAAWRIDLVAVEIPASGGQPEIRHLPYAVRENG